VNAIFHNFSLDCLFIRIGNLKILTNRNSAVTHCCGWASFSPCLATVEIQAFRIDAIINWPQLGQLEGAHNEVRFLRFLFIDSW